MKFRGKYGFLSNFSKSEIVFRGNTFPTAEHAYQAAKATNNIDFLKIKNAESPSTAKKIGSTIPVIEGWESKKVPIMKEILEIKFSNDALSKKLVEVKGGIVEENDWGDTFWGVYNGKGKNVLGKLLTQIRDEISLLKF